MGVLPYKKKKRTKKKGTGKKPPKKPDNINLEINDENGRGIALCSNSKGAMLSLAPGIRKLEAYIRMENLEDVNIEAIVKGNTVTVKVGQNLAYLPSEVPTIRLEMMPKGEVKVTTRVGKARKTEVTLN